MAFRNVLLRASRKSASLPRRILPSSVSITNPRYVEHRFFSTEQPPSFTEKKEDTTVDIDIDDSQINVDPFDTTAEQDTAKKMMDGFDFGENDMKSEMTEDDTMPRGQMKEPAPANEETTGSATKHDFQAETKRILNIVANSLYTDKEVFLRELISNASDALEKARYVQSHKSNLVEPERPLEIHVTADADNHTLTIQDYGVGMTKQELINHLGTIARSGSKAFVESMETGNDNIIGQFGVGFYSIFMIADRVEVYTQPCEATESGGAAQAWCWTSDGSGEYEIAEAQGIVRGTKIIAHLKEDARQFAVRLTLEGIIKKYSNFVGFPIFLNGEEVNTIDAIWTRSKNSVTEEEHTQFYRYISNAFDTPPYRLHFNADVPIAINALFYLPERHMEKFGMGKMDPGVSLYSRKVLIQAKSQLILPDWLRFVKGVVDSEDIPLNISRENMQDSALITRINNILTKRVIKFIEAEAKKDPKKYNGWLDEFGRFLKEGVVQDFTHKQDIARLLRFDSSRKLADGETRNNVSLDDYIAAMPVGQNDIYFLNSPNRNFAESSPYYESFRAAGTEVLFLYSEQLDDIVMRNLGTYETRKLISIESAEAHEGKTDDSEVHNELLDFVQETLSDRVSLVKASTRLSSSPAIVVDHESGSIRRMMKMVDNSQANMALPKQKLEINPNHAIIRNAYAIRWEKPEVATLVLQQMYDNALISADLLDNPRTMIERLNQILEQASMPQDEADIVEEESSSEQKSQ